MASADFSEHRHLPGARDLPWSTHWLSRGLAGFTTRGYGRRWASPS